MATVTEVQPARRRPRRWIAAVVVVVILAIVLVVAELVARTVVPQVVRSQVVSSLGLPEDQRIDVAIPGLVLPQLAVGSIAQMDLTADDVEVEGVSGDVRVDIQDAPVWGGGDWSSAKAVVQLDEDQLRAILGRVDGFPVDAVTLRPPEVALDTEFSVFGVSVPLGVQLSASAEGGDLVLSPTRLRLGGVDVSADALRQQIGPLAGSFAENWRVCLAQYLPRALTLTGVTIEGRHVAASFDIDSAILRDKAAQEPGSCADDR